METYYFTFGANQPNQGKCQPIRAPNGDIARLKMISVYDNIWSMQYSEEQWKSVQRKLKITGMPIEEELPAIVVNENEFSKYL